MHNIVKDYYGNVLTGSDDLQTNACCTDDNLSTLLKSILTNIHDDVMTRYYGCGLVTPELLEGCHVLDLGCGAGRDCYAIAQMVGENGFVTGVDMTDEQLAVANQHSEYHREKFGYAKANTQFLKGYIDEALTLGIQQFSFTGGEPFLAKDIIDILAYASQFAPCLVLTNGTEPLLKRFDALCALQDKQQYPISLRISIDSHDENTHDKSRGKGNFAKAFIGMRMLHNRGFNVSLARHIIQHEDTAQVNQHYQNLFELNGLPSDTNIVAFPDFLPPGALPDVPHITTSCMTKYQTEQQQKSYMCANSKRIEKKNQQMQVYAYTLVDDDSDYFLSTSLSKSMEQKINLKHHRCYSCFAHGASCSEQ